MRLFLTFLLVLSIGNIYAQNKSHYLFIEPNASFSYDNSDMKLKDSFSNSVRGTEAYGFVVTVPNRTRTYFQVGADRTVMQVSPDSLYKAQVSQISRYAGDSIVIVDKKMISYKGFIGIGYVAMHRKGKEYAVAFSCDKYFEDGHCQVYYTSSGKQPIADLNKDYAKLTRILDSIQTYTNKEMATEDDLIKRQYTIVVDSLNLPDMVPSATFTGLLRTKERMQHTVKAVQVDQMWHQPDYRGNVIFWCMDAEKGKLQKKGELILLNTKGKEVRIPFTFTYTNIKGR